MGRLSYFQPMSDYRLPFLHPKDPGDLVLAVTVCACAAILGAAFLAGRVTAA